MKKLLSLALALAMCACRKLQTYLMSISEDRKEIEVFVSFEMSVVALGVTGGHKILKAGDPLAWDSAEERTDQTMDNITVRSIPESDLSQQIRII